MSEVRITDPKTGGQKGQKPERFGLIPFEALSEVARVYDFGAKKYSNHNWRKGYAWSLSFDALLRHIAKAITGEWRDEESGLPHLAHAVFHCLTLITFEALGLGTDDRPTSAKQPRALKAGDQILLISAGYQFTANQSDIDYFTMNRPCGWVFHDTGEPVVL